MRFKAPFQIFVTKTLYRMANILKVKQAEVSMNLGNNMYPMTTWTHPVYVHSGLNLRCRELQNTNRMPSCSL